MRLFGKGGAGFFLFRFYIPFFFSFYFFLFYYPPSSSLFICAIYISCYVCVFAESSIFDVWK